MPRWEAVVNVEGVGRDGGGWGGYWVRSFFYWARSLFTEQGHFLLGKVIFCWARSFFLG